MAIKLESFIAKFQQSKFKVCITVFAGKSLYTETKKTKTVPTKNEPMLTYLFQKERNQKLPEEWGSIN